MAQSVRTRLFWCCRTRAVSCTNRILTRGSLDSPIVPTRRTSNLCVLFLLVPVYATAQSTQAKVDVWRDVVSLRLPEDPVVEDRLKRSAAWLVDHIVTIQAKDDGRPLRVVAWKDPTLEPEDPKLLAGYVITDTLWAAKALKLFDPKASNELEESTQHLGWYGNGLHDVLFHPIDRLRHRPDDPDIVHGHSLGRFPGAGGTIVDLRVARQRWDASFDLGHPALFAEHAVYAALNDFWHGRTGPARRRILDVIADSRKTDTRDRIFWDDGAGILVDHVSYADWLAFRAGKRDVCRHFTFKLGVLLYAIRVMGLEAEIGAPLQTMIRRLWSAQTKSGGVAHFVDAQADGKGTAGREPTGEASAIAILAELVQPPP
jgi:hypothetical protein